MEPALPLSLPPPSQRSPALAQEMEPALPLSLPPPSQRSPAAYFGIREGPPKDSREQFLAPARAVRPRHEVQFARRRPVLSFAPRWLSSPRSRSRVPRRASPFPESRPAASPGPPSSLSGSS